MPANVDEDVEMRSASDLSPPAQKEKRPSIESQDRVGPKHPVFTKNQSDKMARAHSPQKPELKKNVSHAASSDFAKQTFVKAPKNQPAGINFTDFVVSDNKVSEENKSQKSDLEKINEVMA
jgi:hypothetical protein